MEERINIVFVTDNNYFKNMCVAIESIVRNTNIQHFNFYIFSVGISKQNKDFIKMRYSKLNFIFIEIDDDFISRMDIKTHVSKAAFAKIYMPEFIDEQYVIYLDCDLVVNIDIKELWNEIDDSIIQAVWNPFYDYDNEYIGIKNKKTFNSGVMILNLELMRMSNATEELKDFLERYNDKTELHDQAAFNAVFKDGWKELDLSWNVQVNMYLNDFKTLGIAEDKYNELISNPKIVHFTSNSKPWHFRNNHPHKYLYKKYYENCFGSLKYEDINIISAAKKFKEFLSYK